MKYQLKPFTPNIFFPSWPAAATAEKVKSKRDGLTGGQQDAAPHWCVSSMKHHIAAGIWKCRTPAHIPFTAKQLAGYRIIILHPLFP